MNHDQLLFTEFGLTSSQLEKVIGKALDGHRHTNAYCDIYLQSGRDQSLFWEQGLLRSTSNNLVRGGGVRVVIGDKTGYSFTDHLTLTNLNQAARTSGAIANYGSDSSIQSIQDHNRATPHNLYPVATTDVGLWEKIALLRSMDQTARAVDSRIIYVAISLTVEDQCIAIFNSLGQLLVDRRPQIHVKISCVAEEHGRKEQGGSGGGGRHEFRFFTEDKRWRRYAIEAANNAVTMLGAQPALAGEMTVVLGPGWPGVLLHEAVGHPLEGDMVRKGTSPFSKEMIGQRVASPSVTVVDRGNIPGRRGSLNFDDEGTPTRETVLIENGILRGFMLDRMNGALLSMSSTGNCRRQSYRSAPLPRMTNTFMTGGEYTPEEIIASVEDGIYAIGFSGGQVDITAFTFSTSRAYRIEKGRITHPIKGATLIGDSRETLKQVTMVGNDWSLDSGVGFCGKEGQTVPVGVGMPTTRVDGVTVGGTKL